MDNTKITTARVYVKIGNGKAIHPATKTSWEDGSTHVNLDCMCKGSAGLGITMTHLTLVRGATDATCKTTRRSRY